MTFQAKFSQIQGPHMAFEADGVWMTHVYFQGLDFYL